MSFQEVLNLDAEVTTALGGFNKKTGQKNPTQVEGYYIGTRKVKSKKARSGYDNLHILQTVEGNLGVWGKTDLDHKMTNVKPGVMIRITQSGKRATPNGDMYKFRVEFDNSNTIDVSALSETSSTSEETYDSSASESYDSSSSDEDDAAFTADEVLPAKAVAPKKPMATPDAARQARVQAILNGTKGKTA